MKRKMRRLCQQFAYSWKALNQIDPLENRWKLVKILNREDVKDPVRSGMIKDLLKRY